MEKISIVIPVYKAEQTIERCVKSIEDNTFQDYEIILIEDGSNDNSWEMCQKLQGQYSNIIILQNEQNRGVSYTRNRGIKAATGEYIMFVDSDDWVDNRYYENFNMIVEQYGESFAICGYVNHDEKQNARTDEYRWGDEKDIREVSLQNYLKQLYDECLLQQLWNKIFVARIIKENNICFDENISIGEDFRFILDYLKVANFETVLLLNKPLYHYMRDQDGSLMFRVGYESVEEPLINLRKLYELVGMEKDCIEKQIQEDRNYQIQHYAYLIMHNAGMSMREKKKLTLALDEKMGLELFKRNRKVFYKEKIYKIFMR